MFFSGPQVVTQLLRLQVVREGRVPVSFLLQKGSLPVRPFSLSRRDLKPLTSRVSPPLSVRHDPLPWVAEDPESMNTRTFSRTRN